MVVRSEMILKGLKGLAFALGGLVAVLVIAVVIALALFDAEAVKKEAAQAVWASKHRHLKIDGELKLSFWPRLGVAVNKLSLSERDSEQVFAALEHGQLSLAVLPLLSRQVVVDGVDVDGVDVRLIRYADGRLNIDDLLAKDDKPSVLRFDVAAVRLGKSRLAYQDQASGRALILDELAGQTGRLGNAADGKIELAGRLKLNQPAIAGPLRLLGHYRYDLDKKTYAFDGLDVHGGGELAGLADTDLHLLVGALGLKNGALEAIKLEIGVKGKRAGQGFEALLEVPRLGWADQKLTGPALSLMAKLDGPDRHSLGKLGLAGLSLNGDEVKADKFSLELDARQGASGVKLNLVSAATAQIAARSLALPALNGGVELAAPSLPRKVLSLPLTGHLNLDMSRTSLEAAFSTRLDNSSINSQLKLASFNPPQPWLGLDIDQLDLDAYLPAKPAGKAAEKGGEPLDFSTLQNLNLSGSLKVGSLKAAGLRLSNLRLDLNARNGKLAVAPLAANLYQGSLAGSLELDAAGQRLNLRQSLTGVAVGDLLKDLAQKDSLSGRGNVTADLTMAGAGLNAWKQSLAGQVNMNLKDGAIKGINLAKSFRELKARINQRQDVVQAASQDDKTDFAELTASFHIRQGVAHNDDLAAKSPFLRLAGSGDINLPAERLDYLARATIVNTSGGQGGKDLAELGGLTIPVRLSGPFQAPSYKLELANLVTETVKTKVDAKVSDLKQEVRSKAQDAAGKALSDLLRR